MWQDLVKDMDSKMQKTFDSTAHDFSTIRTGRASPALVDSLKVIYYGAPTPLKQIANISVPEPRMIVIQPWDPNAMKDIEKAILTSDIGLQPLIEGKLIRLSVPPLSKDRREELVRVVKKMTEEGKVHIRNIRRDSMEGIKKLEKDKKITEDDDFKAQEEIQKITDRHTKRLDELAVSKEKELLTV